MKLSYASTLILQSGSANLLVTLVLSMLTALVTLTAAKTQLVEQQMATNSHWHIRLSLEARTQWSNAVSYLVTNHETMSLLTSDVQQESIKLRSLTASNESTRSTSLLSRQTPLSKIIDIQTTSTRDDGSDLSASFKQAVQLLTLLTPDAESPPPLTLNGCVISIASGIDIRPLDSDTDTSGEAIRLTSAQPCTGLDAIDIHQGTIMTRELNQSLWSTVFSVSIEAFESMARAEAKLPDMDRRYWLASAADFIGDRWTRSLGHASRPVALYFPPETGCPRFSAGVRIFGVVFIDSSCTDPIADTRLEIFGALVVNGNLNASGADLKLNHIQVADNRLTLLDFPILRSVKIPGSWRDF